MLNSQDVPVTVRSIIHTYVRNAHAHVRDNVKSCELIPNKARFTKLVVRMCVCVAESLAENHQLLFHQSGCLERDGNESHPCFCL